MQQAVDDLLRHYGTGRVSRRDRIQLQGVSFCGGSGALGNVRRRR